MPKEQRSGKSSKSPKLSGKQIITPTSSNRPTRNLYGNDGFPANYNTEKKNNSFNKARQTALDFAERQRRQNQRRKLKADQTARQKSTKPGLDGMFQRALKTDYEDTSFPQSSRRNLQSSSTPLKTARSDPPKATAPMPNPFNPVTRVNGRRFSGTKLDGATESQPLCIDDSDEEEEPDARHESQLDSQPKSPSFKSSSPRRAQDVFHWQVAAGKSQQLESYTVDFQSRKIKFNSNEHHYSLVISEISSAEFTYVPEYCLLTILPKMVGNFFNHVGHAYFNTTPETGTAYRTLHLCHVFQDNENPDRLKSMIRTTMGSKVKLSMSNQREVERRFKKYITSKGVSLRTSSSSLSRSNTRPSNDDDDDGWLSKEGKMDSATKALLEIPDLPPNHLSRRSTRSSTRSATRSTRSSTSSVSIQPKPPRDEVLTTFERVTVRQCDLDRLEEGEFLNDVIINFYMKFMWKNLTPAKQDRIHLFNTFFCKQISATGDWYDKVKSWTKNVDIFSKDFIFIPVNEHAHWFLAIVCFPGMDMKDMICEEMQLDATQTHHEFVEATPIPPEMVEESAAISGYKSHVDEVLPSANLSLDSPPTKTRQKPAETSPYFATPTNDDNIVDVDDDENDVEMTEGDNCEDIQKRSGGVEITIENGHDDDDDNDDDDQVEVPVRRSGSTIAKDFLRNLQKGTEDAKNQRRTMLRGREESKISQDVPADSEVSHVSDSDPDESSEAPDVVMQQQSGSQTGGGSGKGKGRKSKSKSKHKSPVKTPTIEHRLSTFFKSKTQQDDADGVTIVDDDDDDGEEGKVVSTSKMDDSSGRHDEIEELKPQKHAASDDDIGLDKLLGEQDTYHHRKRRKKATGHEPPIFESQASQDLLDDGEDDGANGVVDAVLQRNPVYTFDEENDDAVPMEVEDNEVDHRDVAQKADDFDTEPHAEDAGSPINNDVTEGNDVTEVHLVQNNPYKIDEDSDDEPDQRTDATTKPDDENGRDETTKASNDVYDFLDDDSEENSNERVVNPNQPYSSWGNLDTKKKTTVDKAGSKKKASSKGRKSRSKAKTRRKSDPNQATLNFEQSATTRSRTRQQSKPPPEPTVKITKMPCILLFDSLGMKRGTSAIVKRIRLYLEKEWQHKKGETGQEKRFRAEDFPLVNVKVPQQSNHCDCGVFVILYMSYFLSYYPFEEQGDVIGFDNYARDKADWLNHLRWFPSSDAPKTRALIKDIIRGIKNEKVRSDASGTKEKT